MTKEYSVNGKVFKTEAEAMQEESRLRSKGYLKFDMFENKNWYESTFISSTSSTMDRISGECGC